MAGTADDVIQRQQDLASARAPFDRVWQQVKRVAAPETKIVQNGLSTHGGGPNAARGSKDIYDTTAITAIDRLSSGIEALVIPQSEYWHGLGIVDLTKDQLADDEKLWLERQRNMLFKVRYDADSGWVNASQLALRRCIAFGTGLIWTEEGYDSRALIRYRPLPVFECYLAEDHNGAVDTFYRQYSYTARQAVQKFGDAVSPQIKAIAEKPGQSEQRFPFIQAVQRRSEFGSPTGGVRNTPWASLHVEVDARSVVKESGFYDFPVIDFRWQPEDTYGEGPIMRCLADIQSLNQMAKNEMVAGQQAIDPPLLVANAGVMNRPNSNPGAINYGGLNPAGQRLIEPMFSGQRLDFATMVLEAKRNQVKDSMYLNLFALLVQNPQMSATEALIRANEKGELLGPAGSRLQQSLSRMVDREMGILIRRGLYERGSAFEVPRSLQNADTLAQMTSPLDRLRRTKEAEGTLRLMEVASPLAQVDPTVLDAVDPDETIRGLADIFGVPVSFIRTKDRVAEIRANREAAQQQQQQAMIAEQLAKASAQGSQALVNSREAGLL